jgi:putative ABC transport system permease protein
MPLSNVVHLYVVRLKARVVLVQEVFAVVGIAVGVALLFASQIASTSLNGSVAQLTSGVVGKSRYQLRARGQQGFSEALLGRVQSLAGVSAAIPVLELQASMTGPRGQAGVDLIASDPRFVRLAGPLLRHFGAGALAHQQALALPAPVAKTIGVGPLEAVKLQVGGRVVSALVAAELSEANIGQLVNSPVAVAPLSYAQQLVGMPGRITRIFVQVKPGHGRDVEAELRRLAAGRLNVEPADFDATLFGQAAGPVNQSTATFAMICALVGFLFAYCSMLLTMDLRRALVRELRRSGSTRWETVKVLLFDALVLGTIASVLGLALGDLLSILVFPTSPGYLSFAFAVGAQRIVTWQSVAISVAVAMSAAGIGVLTPLRDVWMRARPTNQPGWRRVFGGRTAVGLGAGAVCLATTTTILVAAPQAAVTGVVLLIAALVLLLPFIADAAMIAFDRLQRSMGSAATEITVAELRSPTTRTRSMAIAATGAIAVFGSVTIQGSHTNLQSGLDRLVHQLSMVAGVWVLPPGEQNTLATTPFADSVGSALARLPGVRAVGRYRAGFLEYGGRRIWALAPPSTASNPIPPSQLVTGNLGQATSRLREGGWAVLSQALASEHHLRIGQAFTLPTVDPMTLRLAATSTNLGWPPGAAILNGRDYTRAWASTAPSAYNVVLNRGASAAQVSQEIRRVLGREAALTVQTERQREASQMTVSHQGLSRLTQIALLVLTAGLLATATSMGAAIWQRRRRFARMKFQGLTTDTLWASLLWESVLLLGTGCLAGSLFGVYGQLLLSHALMSVTGFPVIFSLGASLALGSFALITVVAAAMIGAPGYRAASIRPYPYS